MTWEGVYMNVQLSKNEIIDPETFKAWEYSGPYIISRDPKLSDDVMKTQILLCEEYDKKYG